MAMDTASAPQKRAKLDNGDSYIPTAADDGQSTASIIFSLVEEKGALARALKPFDVRFACT